MKKITSKVDLQLHFGSVEVLSISHTQNFDSGKGNERGWHMENSALDLVSNLRPSEQNTKF
jgi:hypothetical protein